MISGRHALRRRRRLTAAAAIGGLLIAGGAAGRVHRIQQGDTLGALARRYGVPLSALVSHNGIADPNHIVAGATLNIPEPTGSHAPVTAKATPVVAAPAAATVSRPVAMRADRASLAPVFDEYARAAGVPADLAKALAWQESGWQTRITSSTKAVGVMQLMPDTVEFVSRILLRVPSNLDPRDPAQNIRMGTRFLRYLLDRSGGNVDRALAAYYQGLRSVTERGIFPDTNRYVANVKALRARF
jgi:hypothetical protein